MTKAQAGKVMVEHIVRRELFEVQRDPRRSIRNLVDLGLLWGQCRRHRQGESSQAGDEGLLYRQSSVNDGCPSLVLGWNVVRNNRQG